MKTVLAHPALLSRPGGNTRGHRCSGHDGTPIKREPAHLGGTKQVHEEGSSLRCWGGGGQEWRFSGIKMLIYCSLRY